MDAVAIRNREGVHFGQYILDHFTEIESIEVVPGYLLPDSVSWCIVDGVLGVDRKKLIASYLAVCPVNPRDFTANDSLLTLIATSENVSAINARKRLVSEGKIDVDTEFRLSAIILRSPLFKHCKSSILWYHRRWLIENYQLSTSLSQEWELVSKAAHYHPKNYYAWGYLRWYCLSIEQHPQARIGESSCKFFRTNLRILCQQNLGDVSMWTFLHWLQDEELEEFAQITNKLYPGHPSVMAGTQFRI